MRQRWFRQILRRRFFVILLLLLQAYVLYRLISSTSQVADWVSGTLSIVSLLVALRIISTREKPTYKLLWIFLILLVPVFGGLLYLLISYQASTKWVNQRLSQLEEEIRPFLREQKEVFDRACQLAPECVPQMRYLKNAGFPVYQHTQCTYYSPGEQWFQQVWAELQKAERYIFLEFFTIQEGVLWDTMLNILTEKARRGVTVRVLYDDIGSFLTLPKDYPKHLEVLGIECRIFNPFRPILSSFQNNRDHRKIISVDGKVAFTGGINLADEYINAVEKHGHWKDCGIMVAGDAAWSLTALFLQMWNLSHNTKEDVCSYQPWPDQICPVEHDGFVLPYGDSPVDKENVGEHVYLQIINNAKDYVYINTPYLIVDDSMVSALTLAAKSGVDVRIVTPHRWDKWIIHMTTRAYYRPLIEAGVKIYEYTTGFIHSKTFVSDSKVATVGTTNLDYRSLYLHFECGVWMYKTRAVEQIRDDYLSTLNICQEITLQDCRVGPFTCLFQELLRLCAPLL